MQAAIDSGAARFRPILLTSLTTFFGLVPIVLERSMQAQIVIPMAVSLAFGIVFATAITLVLIPCLYSIQANIHEFFMGKRERRVPDASSGRRLRPTRVAGDRSRIGSPLMVTFNSCRAGGSSAPPRNGVLPSRVRRSSRRRVGRVDPGPGACARQPSSHSSRPPSSVMTIEKTPVAVGDVETVGQGRPNPCEVGGILAECGEDSAPSAAIPTPRR